MRRTALILLLAMVLPAGAAFAHDHARHSSTMEVGRIESPASWGRRHELGRTRCAMLTRDGSAVLLLTRDRVAVQLSDRTMRQIDRELREEDEGDDDGVLAEVIRGAVMGSVRAMLNHSVECPIADLDDVRYRGGRLELITADGGRLFEDMQVDDRDLLESFWPADARAFVGSFHRLKRAGR